MRDPSFARSRLVGFAGPEVVALALVALVLLSLAFLSYGSLTRNPGASPAGSPAPVPSSSGVRP